MNTLVITWSMLSAACAMLGLVQLLLWVNRPREPAYFLSMIMAFSAALVAQLEMRLFSTPDPGRFQALLLWQNLAIGCVVVPLVWTVRAYLPVARTWLAWLITTLWIIGVLINFLLPGTLTFSEVTALERLVTPWGDPFYFPEGIVNRWKSLVDITVLLVPVYVLDAAWRSRKAGWGRRRAVITGGMVLFMLFGGVHAILADAGIVETPSMVGVAFLAVVFALTWVLIQDALRVRSLTREVARAHRETERLMRANLLGEVAGSLAHELNQPLAAILGNAQAAQKFMEQGEPDLDELRAILDDIVRDDKRARDIIQDMRRLLQGDRSGYEDLDLVVVIKEILDFAHKELEENGIELHLRVDSQPPTVHGARIGLQQVVLNLVLNAERALLGAPEAAREILISLSGDADTAQVEVRDYGPGVAPDLVDRVFQPFFTTQRDSLGMGLPVCRRIIEAHGGRLTLEQSDGGALFRIRLPGTGP